MIQKPFGDDKNKTVGKLDAKLISNYNQSVVTKSGEVVAFMQDTIGVFFKVLIFKKGEISSKLIA